MKADRCIVYVLTNEAMPDYVKIGMTRTSITQRMTQLYTTAVPVPFECHYAGEVEIAKTVEKRIHRAFDKFRVNKSREFFEIEADAAADIIRMVSLRDVTPTDVVAASREDREAIERLEKRAKRFSFKMVGIAPDTVLTFKLDPEVTCTVLDNHRIAFEGERTSLSAAALIALRRQGFERKAAQGALYWVHDGKTLQDLRAMLEDDEE